MVSRVDQVVACKPAFCSCGAALSAGALRVVESRQVFDLPEPKLQVIEYRRMSGSCQQCGLKVSGSFPAQVSASVLQYGEGVLALAVLLSNACQVSYQKISLLFSDLFGYPVNTSMLLKANGQVYQGLKQSEAQIRKALTQSPLAYFDETGLRVEGKLHWLHSCSNQDYSYLFVDCHRRQKLYGVKRGCLRTLLAGQFMIALALILLLSIVSIRFVERICSGNLRL
jgi:transposase